MDYLYSNRRDYFNRDKSLPNCAFCDALAMPDDYNNLIVHRAKRFLSSSTSTHTSGHMMSGADAAYCHMEELSTNALTEMMLLARRVMVAFEIVYQPQGFNVGLNIGAAGGANR